VQEIDEKAIKFDVYEDIETFSINNSSLNSHRIESFSNKIYRQFNNQHKPVIKRNFFSVNCRKKREAERKEEDSVKKRIKRNMAINNNNSTSRSLSAIINNPFAIRQEIQRFESVHPSIYAIYDLIELIPDIQIATQIREHIVNIEGERLIYFSCNNNVINFKVVGSDL
jgi:hypothetical protein